MSEKFEPVAWRYQIAPHQMGASTLSYHSVWYKEFSEKNPESSGMGQIRNAEPLFTAAQMRQAERDALEQAIAIITEPVGMECCGQPDFDHGHVCCGNGEPAFRTIDESVTAIRALLTPPDGEKG